MTKTIPAQSEASHMATAFGGAALCAVFFLLLLSQAGDIIAGQALLLEWRWVESLDIHLTFLIDGLALLFALIITGIGTLIFLYAASYFKNHPQTRRIHWILIAFMLSMLGLVTADNIMTMFVFWELTTVTSYLLIGTKHESEKARKLALQALIVTGAGGLVFLAGLAMISMGAGSYRISEIVQHSFTGHEHYVPVFILLILGCFTKSAIFPFHFWLPNAMAAPTPISAYLHSATMVKAGIYLLARFSPALAGTDLWLLTLTIGGGITAVWASVLALRQSDLKLMMAYTTLMALGTATFLLGLGSDTAILAAMTFILVHALYKAALFLVVGNIEKATGQRDWCKDCRLVTIMPLTAASAALAALSMAGVPPFFGFIGKELTYEGALALAYFPPYAIISTVVAACLMAGVAFFIMVRPFFTQSKKPDKNRAATYKKPPLLMTWPPFILALGGIFLGLMPEFLAQPLILSAITPLTGIPEGLYLTLWHGWNTALFLSLGTIVAGAFLAWKFFPIQDILDKALDKIPVSCEKIYDLTMKGLLGFAALQTMILQNGRQRFYILTCFSSLTLLSLYSFIHGGIFTDFNWAHIGNQLAGVPLYQWGLSLLIALSIIVTVFSHSRLLAICALGVMGTGIALLFVIFSAPDVAMTLFMIEILVVILMTMVALHLPSFTGKAHGSMAGRFRDGFVALGTGAVVTILMLAVSSTDFDRSVSDFYQAASYSEAHGRNIVNVILVDFRALDTLGEILVVALAGLACFSLLTLKKSRHKGTAWGGTHAKDSQKDGGASP